MAAHRVTMALFENGGFFMTYNHDTGRAHCYAEAVDDLFWHLSRHKPKA